MRQRGLQALCIAGWAVDWRCRQMDGRAGYGKNNRFDRGLFWVRWGFVHGSLAVRFWSKFLCYVWVAGFVSPLPFLGAGFGGLEIEEMAAEGSDGFEGGGALAIPGAERVVFAGWRGLDSLGFEEWCGDPHSGEYYAVWGVGLDG